MKYKDIIISAAAIVLILGGLIWLASPRERETSADGALPSLSAPENLFDFGEISMAAGKVSHIFKVKNIQDQPTTVTKMYTSCMCTEAILITDGADGKKSEAGPYGMPGHSSIPKINKTLQPGEEAEVEAVFDPAAHGPAGIGPVERSIYIETPSASPLELRFKALVKP